MYKECNILLSDMVAIVDEAASLKVDDKHKFYLEEQLKDCRSKISKKILANKESLQAYLAKSKEGVVAIGANVARIEAGEEDYIAMLCIEHKKIVDTYIDAYRKVVSLNKFELFVKRRTQEINFLFINGKSIVNYDVLELTQQSIDDVEPYLDNSLGKESIQPESREVVRYKWGELFTKEAVELLVELFDVVEKASLNNDKTKVLELNATFKDNLKAVNYIITKRRDYFYGYFYRSKNKVVELNINLNRIDANDSDYIAMLSVENNDLINEYINTRKKHFELKNALIKIRNVLSNLENLLFSHKPLQEPELIQIREELIEDVDKTIKEQNLKSRLCGYKALAPARGDDVGVGDVPAFIIGRSNIQSQSKEACVEAKQLVQDGVVPERLVVKTALSIMDKLIEVQNGLMKFTVGLRASLSKR